MTARICPNCGTEFDTGEQGINCKCYLLENNLITL